ncbi:NHL repeat-containing protein [Gracilimonas amylolytica]|uniref:hypothetical protein n=1 Tax=Gracilimonas amylolytica TaxID=1749045 RepID=UPI0013000322|nr:hypothetical protein [Gracilimonas amylolytica]
MDYKTHRNFTGLLVSVLMITGFGCGSGGDDTSAIKKENGVIYNPSVGLLQDEEAPVEFELVETIDLSMIEEPVISNVGYLQIDDEGNFYFIDRRLSKLISLDPEGNLRWAVGEEGKGPGDLESPFGMSLYKDKLYISNVQGSRLDEFDLSGNFIKTYDLPEDMRFASMVGIRDDGKVLMSGANYGAVGALVYTMEISDSLRVISDFKITETEADEYSRATLWGGFAMQEDGFYYSFGTDYTFQMYDYDGNLKTEVQREFDGTLGPGIYTSENSVSLYGLGSIGSPIFLNSDLYLIQVEHPVNIDDPHAYARRASTGDTESPIYEHFMDVYNADHELLYTFEDSDFVEGLGSLSVRDDEGYYYSVFSSDLLIKKYQVNTKYEGSEMKGMTQFLLLIK